jgi:hypothetical protein
MNLGWGKIIPSIKEPNMNHQIGMPLFVVVRTSELTVSTRSDLTAAPVAVCASCDEALEVTAVLVLVCS